VLSSHISFPFQQTLLYNMSQPNSLVCDTIPAARLADPDHDLTLGLPETIMAFDADAGFHDAVGAFESHGSPTLEHEQRMAATQPEPRKLCVRHQRMADEGTNVKLQEVSPSPFVESCSLTPRKKVSRDVASGRKGSCECHLVQFFFVVSSSEGAHPAGSPDNVLLLAIVPHF
jgi:hypothetical protein